MPASIHYARLPPHYRRLLARILAILLGLLGLGLLTIYLLLRPERFTAYLHTRAEAAGLDLELAYPAIPTLLPHPAIRLQGLTLSMPGASQPILVADHGEVELPWISLFQRHAGIAWLQLDGPRIDIDALLEWMRDLPTETFIRAPSLPRIDAGISIYHGSLVGHGQRAWLDELNINAGALCPGHPFHLDMAGNLADTRPFSLRLDMVPAIGEHRVSLRQLQLQLDYNQQAHTRLHGQLDWLGGLDLNIRLDGRIQRPGQADASLQMHMDPARHGQPLLLGLHYRDDSGQADLQLPPDQILQWWATLRTHAVTPSPSLPRWQGHLQADQLDLGEIHLEGLQIDASPAAAGSVANPAPAGGPR